MLSEINVYPIDQGHGRPRSQRGRPMIADGAVAQRVLERMQRLCKRYGVALAIEGQMGVVRLPHSLASPKSVVRTFPENAR